MARSTPITPPIARLAPDASAPLTANQVLLPALLLVAGAIGSHISGLDLRIEDAFFDASSGRFPWRSHLLLESFGHQWLRSTLTGLWALILGATLLAYQHPPWRQWRHLLLATTLGMALGPLLVVGLKSVTTFPCPWSLVRYGGYAPEPTHWFTTPALSGHCFPAGHSAGGFSLFAVAPALNAAGRPRAARWGIAIAVLVGAVATATRLAQGAHFLSHGLWSAAIDWLVAAWLLNTIRIRPTPCAA